MRSVWPTDGRCPALGFTLKVDEACKGFHGADFNSPTLDRFKAERGYVVDNISIISHRANTMKHDETNPSVLRRLADWMELRNRELHS